MMFALAVLAAVIALREAAHHVAERRWARERLALTNAIIARTPQEFVALQRATDPALAPDPKPNGSRPRIVGA